MTEALMTLACVILMGERADAGLDPIPGSDKWSNYDVARCVFQLEHEHEEWNTAPKCQRVSSKLTDGWVCDDDVE